MIRFKALLKDCDIRKFTAEDLALPNIPKEGNLFTQEIAKRYAKSLAAFPRKDRFTETIEITSHNAASSPWYSDLDVRFIIWNGDLTIDGDLLDEDFSMLPLLIIKGNLTLKNWLRGDMPTFVGGNVKASGFIIGHYNDSPLFVGGDLIAAGYIPRAKPYFDLPNVVPHQIAGKVTTKKFDNQNATNETLTAAFVNEVLTKEDEDIYLDERAVFERSDAGLKVWR